MTKKEFVEKFNEYPDDMPIFIFRDNDWGGDEWDDIRIYIAGRKNKRIVIT